MVPPDWLQKFTTAIQPGGSFGMQLPSHPGATQPSKLEGLLGSPLFNVGMGLLSSNRPGGNPAQAVMGGLGNSQGFGENYADKQRIEELRKELAALIAAQQQKQAQAPMQGPPVPQAMRPMQGPPIPYGAGR